jgi:Uncharacterized protein conserved in bacteria (DUF2066)
MALPLMSNVTGRRVRSRIAFALLLLAMAILGLPQVYADDQGDPYSATVKVDATADSAAAARSQARIDGQRRALDNVVQRLSGSSDLSKLPKLDDQAITDIVASFEVANEKMSSVRYLASYTFHFRQAKVRQLLRSAGIGIAASETQSKPVVVLPVYRDGDNLVLWDDPNPWRDAWGQTSIASGPTKLALPLGGVGDLTAIDAEQARSGDAQALAEIAQRNSADETLVAAATPRQQGDRLAGLDITLKRYRLGHLMDSRTEAIDANPGESSSDLFKHAVGVVVTDIEHGGPPAADKETSLSATVPIHSLGEWIEVRRRLAAVPSVRAVNLLTLSREQAKVVIKFVGNSDQLKSGLADANLDLAGTAPDWRLMPAGSGPGGQN